jgi:glutathione peroxidase
MVRLMLLIGFWLPVTNISLPITGIYQTGTNTTGQKISIYDFKVAALDGDSIDFADFKGKKILIVNTASNCGYTSQYAGLQQLYEKYRNKLVIVGFPANGC